MPFTTVAFQESIDPGGAFTAINAAAGEQHVTSSGDNIDVPELSQIIAVAAGVETAVESFARLTAPSLRGLGLFIIEPFSGAAAGAVEPASPQPVMDLRRNPLALVRGEVLNAELNSNPVAAQRQWVAVWLADGPIEPVTGRIFTVRATGATTLVQDTWTNVPLTLAENLPRGRYQLVGMRARSDGCVAARAVFIGGRWRPGCLGVDAQTDLEHMMFRYGQLGVWGEFEDPDLLSVDFLSVSADAAQDVMLDLIQLRAGPA
jgi:hypothetical protein